MHKVYKILTFTQWQDFQNEKKFVGSEHDIRDGFIHLCTSSQVGQIISKYFKAVKDLYLIEFEFQESEIKLKFETSSSEEKYPHFYGPLLFEDVVSSRKVQLN